MTDTDTRLDGNVLGGLLAELFVDDLTVARATCARCAHTGPVAELHVYPQAPGTVARCAMCGHVQLRVVSDHHRWWIDFSGMACIEIEVVR